MRLKNAYYYFFYKLYKFSENSPSRWISDWKAELAIDVLWIFIGLSCMVYYTVFTQRVINVGSGKSVVILYIICVALPNYFIFHHRGQWKKIIYEFDKLPKRINRIGSWIVVGIIILVIVNLVFSFYLMSRR
jgi:hypothetical protein